METSQNYICDSAKIKVKHILKHFERLSKPQRRRRRRRSAASTRDHNHKRKRNDKRSSSDKSNGAWKQQRLDAVVLRVGRKPPRARQQRRYHRRRRRTESTTADAAARAARAQHLWWYDWTSVHCAWHCSSHWLCTDASVFAPAVIDTNRQQLEHGHDVHVDAPLHAIRNAPAVRLLSSGRCSASVMSRTPSTPTPVVVVERSPLRHRIM